MSEYTNGVLLLPDAGRMRGRAAPSYPTLTLPTSGYVVACRRMASGTMAQLRQQAYRELEPEKPVAPAQDVEVAPGEFRTVERTNDPDYVQELNAWADRVNKAAAMKWLRVVQDYALLTPTDQEAVNAYRAAMAAVGVESPDSDREIFVWSIVAPGAEDQQALTRFILGMSEPEPEAVQAHQRTFRGDVPGPSTGAPEHPGGPE